MVSKQFKSLYTHLNISEISEFIFLQNFVNGIVFLMQAKKAAREYSVHSASLENLSNEDFGIFKIFNESKIVFLKKVQIRNFNIDPFLAKIN